MRERGLSFLVALILSIGSFSVSGQEVANGGQLVRIRTESLEVEISLTGGVPVRWSIIDPRFIGEGDESGRVELFKAPSEDSSFPLSLWMPSEVSGNPGVLNDLRYRVTRSGGTGADQIITLEATWAQEIYK